MGTRSENLDLIIRARESGAAKTALDAIQSSLLGIGSALGGAFAAKSLITNFISDVVNLQGQMVDLRAAVQRAGISWEDNEKQIESFTRQMTKQKGVIDDYTRESLPFALDYTKNLGDAEIIVSAAADLAAAKHMDLKTAVDLLGKAYLGHTETLVRYGVEIKDVAQATGNAKYIQEQIDARFEGASAAAASKLTTKIDLLKDAFHDLNEELGKKVGGTSESGGLFGFIIEGATSALDNFRQAIEKANNPLDYLLIQQQAWLIAADKLAEKNRGLSDAELEAALHGATLGKELQWVKTAAEAAAEGIGKATTAVADQLPKLFEDPNFIKLDDWWKATEDLKSMATEVYNAWAATYDTTGNEAEDAAIRAQEMWGDGGDVELSTSTSAVKIASAWKQAFTSVGSSIKTTSNLALDLAQSVAEGMRGAFKGASDYILGQWKWLQSESKSIWEAMAKDFLSYFVDTILDAVGGKLVKGILGFIGSLFDTPANDRMAQRQGDDFARHFTRGIWEHLRDNMAQTILTGFTMEQMYGALGFSQFRGSTQVPQYGLAPAVNVYVTGNVMTSDFVQNQLGPLIEKYSRGGSVNINYENSFKTGAPVLAF